MAKTKRPPTTTPNIVRKCLTCSFAHLVQYKSNPILAECAFKEKRDRQVASRENCCPLYIVSNHLPQQIEHRSSYAVQ